MLEVVAGVISNSNNKILIARKKKGKHLEGYWEFPRRKIEQGEKPQESLIREIREEMDTSLLQKIYQL